MEKAMEKNIRAFISVKLPKDISDKIITAGRKMDRSWARPVCNSVHVTLLFFADGISKDQLGMVIDCIDAVHVKPFTIKVKGIDVLGGRPPRVVYACIEKNDELAELQENLRVVLEGMGMKFDKRRFLPHVTIARIGRPNAKDLSSFLSKYKNFEFGSFTCEEVFLVKSVLAGGGPLHTDLHVKRLQF